MIRSLSLPIFAGLFLTTGCVVEDPVGNQNPSPQFDGGALSLDAGPPPSFCETLGLNERPFDSTAPSVLQRRQPAGDFTVPTIASGTFILSERWTGCETYLFMPHNTTISDLDNNTVWSVADGIPRLIEKSPRNAHYFFVVTGRDSPGTRAAVQAMQGRIDDAIVNMDDTDREHWKSHLHVVSQASRALEGLVDDMFKSDVARFGFAIDRFQRLRGLGNLAAVDAHNAQLQAQERWPWERRLYGLAYEAQYFNFEMTREERLETQNVTLVSVLGGDVIEQFEEATINLPDASTMASFDTLEIDILMECPNREAAEPSNCGPWDYLAHFWLWDEGTESWLEAARFITTYHRESRWVVDASHALAWLQEGGERRVKYEWAPAWNKQPTAVTASLRLYNQGKGMRPQEIFPLFGTHGFNPSINDREPVAVDLPADLGKVELVAITTGHGMEAQNCAEFCRHSHHYTVGNETFVQAFNEPGDQSQCAENSGEGTVPNQWGTWWFGRGGWCPGREVYPFIADVTEQVSAGGSTVVSYEAKLNNGPPIEGAGTINHNSWLVIHR